MAASVTVGDVTVGATANTDGDGLWFIGYLPTNEGLDFSIVAVKGKPVTFTDREGREHEGVIAHASRVLFALWVEEE
jgi:hypothetical protein